jgi:hypothetical protein
VVGLTPRVFLGFNPSVRQAIPISILVLAFAFFTGCSKTPPAKVISPEAAQQSRLDWNMKTLVSAYEEDGNTDPAWDAPAKRALTEFARSRAQVIDPGEPWVEIIATNCEAAIDAGCDDPLIRYLYIKNSMSQTNTPRAFCDAFDEVESNMQHSLYPDIRKFYASLRAYQQYYYVYDRDTNHDFTPGYQLLDDALSNLVATLEDKTVPPEESYDACSEFIHVVPGDLKMFQEYYDQIEKPLFANWPDEATSWLVKGQAYRRIGWYTRGYGPADTLPAANLRGLNKNLAIAEKALNRAWELNPTDARIAVEMMGVGQDAGEGSDHMEKWFNRAMEDDPDDYDACKAKLDFVSPNWAGGSPEAMLEFGRECVQNTNWGAGMALILIDAHYDIYSQYIDPSDRTNYYKQPYVWADINSAYQRYFQEYPEDPWRTAYYAWYAYNAEQWNKFNELAPKVDPYYYSLFGGKDKFDAIVQLAKEKAPQQ